MQSHAGLGGGAGECVMQPSQKITSWLFSGFSRCAFWIRGPLIAEKEPHSFLGVRTFVLSSRCWKKYQTPDALQFRPLLKIFPSNGNGWLVWPLHSWPRHRAISPQSGFYKRLIRLNIAFITSSPIHLSANGWLVWPLRSLPCHGDEVVNAIIKLINRLYKTERTTKADGVLRRQVFGTFLNTLYIRGLSGYSYTNQRAYTPEGVDVLELDFMFFPVNINNENWVGAGFDFRRTELMYLDFMRGPDILGTAELREE